MLYSKFQGSMFLGSGEEEFQKVFTIWAWWPSWSYDLGHLNKIAFSLSLEAVYEIKSKLAQWFQWRLKVWQWNLSILYAHPEPLAQGSLK